MHLEPAPLGHGQGTKTIGPWYRRHLVPSIRHLRDEDSTQLIRDIGNTIVQLRGPLCCGRMNQAPERRDDENDQLSSGHAAAVYGARYSRHEQGVQPWKLRGRQKARWGHL